MSNEWEVEPLNLTCLCVTEKRPTFFPWLIWCFDRQTWPHKELVIVDSSNEPYVSNRSDIRVVQVDPGTGVARKRNIALQEARGEVITWFDDDDWQHPNKLAWLAEALLNGASYAGCSNSWFVDLATGRCVKHRGQSGGILFNSAGFMKNAVQTIPFKEDIHKASDTHWMHDLERRLGHASAHIIDDKVLFFWLCHEDNLSNPSKRRQFSEPLSAVKNLVGIAEWGDTEEALAALRSRLQKKRAGNDSAVNTSCKNSDPERKAMDRVIVAAKTETEKDRERDKVSVMIKATVMDVPYLEVMTRHMIAQAKFPFQERVIVVDRRATFSGKYSTRLKAPEENLNRVLDKLKNDRIIDRVVDVDYSESHANTIMKRYFGKQFQEVPTHAYTGGPIYPTLFGMESLLSDYVLQMDADVFFHTSKGGWVDEALRVMKKDQRLWLMMTHPGPPAGPPGGSLGARNARLATWDRNLEVWRFATATTRYFICDRRNFYGRLRPIFRRGGCAPLEQCISRTLRENGAYRGALGNLKSWHLHAWYHGDPFSEWVESIAAAVEAGRFPDSQQGGYDLRLDLARDRDAWKGILQSKGAANSVGMYCPEPGSIPKQVNSTQAIVTSNACHVIRENPIRNQNMESAQTARFPEKAIAGKIVVRKAPLAVIIPVRDRAGQRLRNALHSLHWQASGFPQEVLVVSHGSSPAIDDELARLCAEFGARLIKIGKPDQRWNKPLALNVGIRATSPDVPFVMSMDADMILAPNFLTVVLKQLKGETPALVLCRSADLPPDLSIPEEPDKLRNSLDEFRAKARMRARYGTGGIQAARRSFFFDVRGYDEDLAWWGAMDGDMVQRASKVGLLVVWIEDRTSMFHQWHRSKYRSLENDDEVKEAKLAWKTNHMLAQQRRAVVIRNPDHWGGLA